MLKIFQKTLRLLKFYYRTVLRVSSELSFLFILLNIILKSSDHVENIREDVSIRSDFNFHANPLIDRRGN